MHDSHEFLRALAVVLSVAALTTVVFQRLGQPVVLGYLIAGLIVGPHVPIPLVADPGVVHTLSELGVILLMFSLGLEFSLRKLVQVGPAAGITAIVQSSLMIWLGFLTGRLFGWTTLECLFTGALIAISSTTIIAKAFDEQRIGGRLREIVVGVLIVEDLIAILLMAVLTAVASGSGLAAGPLLSTVGRLAAFLAALIGAGLLVVPWLVRVIVARGTSETTLVASIGICFSIALLADAAGYSVALGAFLAGSLIAESGLEKPIERRIEPVRDVFAAVFFVSVGMQIDPGLVARHWPSVAVLSGVVIGGKVLGVSLGAFLTGAGLRTSVQAGMSLAQIGEFSFIIAALGLSLRATGDFLYPVAAAVSALTTLTTPWLIRASGPTASFLDRKLPKPLQTFGALYGSWLEELRSAPRSAGATARVRRLLRLLVLDAALLAALVAGAATAAAPLGDLAERLGVPVALVHPLVIAGALVLATPLCVGMLRVARQLGTTLAGIALPERGGARVDLASAPRRAFVVALQLAVFLLAGAPLLAFTQPFLPTVPGAALLGLLLLLFLFSLWRSATDLQGHVRAGAQVIVEALAARVPRRNAPVAQDALRPVHELLPGLGSLVALRLDPGSPAIGKTLAELNLRGETGATVLAITRGEGALLVPVAEDRLALGDVLALAGTSEAIEAARARLQPDAGPAQSGSNA
jgi:CPA2 family monovalent cation:H+ antiporter-2